MHNDWDLYERVWIGDDAQSLQKRMTSINEETKKTVDPESLSKLILDQFNQTFQNRFIDYQFSASEMTKIESLTKKYAF